MAKVRGRDNSSSASFFLIQKDHLSTHLSLGQADFHKSQTTTLISMEHQFEPSNWTRSAVSRTSKKIVRDVTTFYVKVYMEGDVIGRKVDLLANGGFIDLICTINYIFETAIIWSEEEGEQSKGHHILTYKDKEGDWLMVGDIPWEMFLSSVKRLKITRQK